MERQQSAANDLLFDVKDGIGRATFNPTLFNNRGLFNGKES